MIVLHSMVSRLRESALVRDSGAVAIGAGTSKLLTLMFFMYAARVLDTAEYGEIRFSVSWGMVGATLMTPLAHMLTTYLARNADEPARRSVCLGTALTVAGFLLIVTVFLNGIVMSMVGGVNPGVWAVLLGLAAFNLYGGFLRGNSSFRKLALYECAHGVVRLVTLGALMALDRVSVQQLLLVYGVPWIVTAIMMEIAAHDRRKWTIARPSTELCKELLSFSIPLIASYAIHVLLINGGILALRMMSNETQAGYYGVANPLASVLLLLGNSVFSVVLPASARLSGVAGLRQMERGAMLVGLACLPFVLCFWLAGHWVIEILFTSRYVPGTQTLQVLVVGMVFYALINTMSGYWIAHGRSFTYSLILSAALVLAFTLCMLLIPAYGALGAALSFTGGTLLGFILMLVCLARMRRSMSCLEWREGSPPMGNEVDDDQKKRDFLGLGVIEHGV